MTPLNSRRSHDARSHREQSPHDHPLHPHPPLAVGLKDGIGLHFIINLLLTFLLFGIGGVIHALWRVLR